MPTSTENGCKICVIGSINMDLVVRTPRFVRSGETLAAHSWSSVPGGKGANQVVAAARLGASAVFCGSVGADDFGKTLRAGLISENVDVTELSTAVDCGAGVAMITVDDAGHNAIYVVGGANHLISANGIRNLESTIKAAQFLLLQLEIPLEATLCAIEIAKRHGIPTLLDPAPAPKTGFPTSLLQINVLSPNESEAESLTGIVLSDIALAKRAAIELAKRGAEQVVIKLGERGALALDRSGAAWHINSAPVKVVDSTAAGDAFSAALAVSLAQGNDLVNATRFACAAGAVAVGRAGAQPSMPTREEVEQLIQLHEFRARSV